MKEHVGRLTALVEGAGNGRHPLDGMVRKG